MLLLLEMEEAGAHSMVMAGAPTTTSWGSAVIPNSVSSWFATIIMTPRAACGYVRACAMWGGATPTLNVLQEGAGAPAHSAPCGKTRSRLCSWAASHGRVGARPAQRRLERRGRARSGTHLSTITMWPEKSVPAGNLMAAETVAAAAAAEVWGLSDEM